MESELFDQLFDLMNCFALWCDHFVDIVSSLGDSPGVCPQSWLALLLSYTGLLEDAGFRFDVIVRSLFRVGKSVCLSAERVVSDATEDGDGIPMTTFAPSWGGGGFRVYM